MTWKDKVIFILGVALIVQAVYRGSQFQEAAIGASLLGVPGAAKFVKGPTASVKIEASASV